jgi:hypothetical protein
LIICSAIFYSPSITTIASFESQDANGVYFNIPENQAESSSAGLRHDSAQQALKLFIRSSVRNFILIQA